MSSVVKLLSILFLLFCLFSVGSTSKLLRLPNSNACKLCNSKTHVFRDHILDRDLDNLKKLIEEFFENFDYRGASTTYLGLINYFLATDVNFILNESDDIEKDEHMLLNIFRLLLSSYRTLCNPNMLNISKRIASIEKAVSKIVFSDVRLNFDRILSKEFRIFVKEERNLSNDLPIIDHIRAVQNHDCKEILQMIETFSRSILIRRAHASF